MLLDTFAIQKQIVSLLRDANVAVASTMDDIRRIYDDVPQDINTGKGGYVEIAGYISEEDDSSGSDGIRHTVTLNIWSEYKGFKEVSDIGDAIRDTLHHLETSAGDMNVIMFVDSIQGTGAGMSDGVTRQGIVRIRCQCRT